MNARWTRNADGSWSGTANGHSLHVWQSGSLWVATCDGNKIGKLATATEAKLRCSQRAGSGKKWSE